MNPADLSLFLNGLIQNRLKLSTMIWGPPGIGKSSIVMQTATKHGLDFVDLRLSQLAPTDLRGLPVADDGISRWFPPEFLPRDGAGVLFLDEINLAPPAMQGIAQQLILDRKVGSYVVPDGWYIWAAGNRKEDRAAVFDMPAPVANRFLHVDVGPDFESFKIYALASGIHEQILAFLSFRPALLHKLDPQQPAWPSPRSWVMASELHRAGLEVAAAIGAAAATEFHAYLELYGNLPDLERVLAGDGDDIPFPSEPSIRYATTVGLTARANDAQASYHAFRWLAANAAPEWVQLCAADLFRQMRAKNEMRQLGKLIAQDPLLEQWIADMEQLLSGDQQATTAPTELKQEIADIQRLLRGKGHMPLDPSTARAVSAALLRVCNRSTFFATLALFARVDTSASVPTAATDGRDIFVNPAFFSALSSAEQDGVLLHEVLHAALLHVPRRGSRDPQLWNVAADIVVNGMIAKEGYTLPDGALRDLRNEHLSTEEVYDLLAQSEQQPAPAPWSDLLDARPDDASLPADAGMPSDEQSDRQGRRAALERYWRDAQQQARMVAESSQAGSMPAGLERELGSLSEARIDWRSYLWRYMVQTPHDFTSFDRRFVGQGLYLEALSGESVHVRVAVDTSGSINPRSLDVFLSEVRAILYAYPHLRCDLYYADSALHGPFPLTPGGSVPPPVGGGGTDFRPFFERLEAEHDSWSATVAVYLTDGYGDFPAAAPSEPVLWVVTPGGMDVSRFPFGEAVRLTEHIEG